MQIENLTVKCREALQEAAERARRASHPEVTPLHLFQALLEQEGGLLKPVLDRLGVSAEPFGEALRAELARLPEQSGSDLAFSRDLARLLESARRH